VYSVARQNPASSAGLAGAGPPLGRRTRCAAAPQPGVHPAPERVPQQHRVGDGDRAARSRARCVNHRSVATPTSAGDGRLGPRRSRSGRPGWIATHRRLGRRCTRRPARRGSPGAHPGVGQLFGDRLQPHHLVDRRGGHLGQLSEPEQVVTRYPWSDQQPGGAGRGERRRVTSARQARRGGPGSRRPGRAPVGPAPGRTRGAPPGLPPSRTGPRRRRGRCLGEQRAESRRVQRGAQHAVAVVIDQPAAPRPTRARGRAPPPGLPPSVPPPGRGDDLLGAGLGEQVDLTRDAPRSASRSAVDRTRPVSTLSAANASRASPSRSGSRVMPRSDRSASDNPAGHRPPARAGWRVPPARPTRPTVRRPPADTGSRSGRCT